MEQQLDKLTKLGAEAVQSAIVEYTHWHTTSAICWLTFALACIVAALIIWRKREAFGDYATLWVGILSIIAAIAIPCNVPTLLHPKAYAIHQLLTDATK